MEPLPNQLIKRLDLRAAVEEECAAWRNLLPPEPWRDQVREHAGPIARYVESRLRAGHRCAPNYVVNARKGGLGIRPVPIVGIVERVAYRALAKELLPEEMIPDRSAEAYRDFLKGPIDHWFETRPDLRQLWDSTAQYVVESDVTAFYQYVDHEVLRHEIEMRTESVEEAAHLVELLGEIEGRSFGLPQLLDPSDWFSDLYIDMMHRDLVRSGWSTWRYNDDFRILCESWSDALRAVEALADAARRIGLVLSEYKTVTPSFFTYFVSTTGMGVAADLATVDPDDVEVAVMDYATDDPEESVERARATLDRVTDSEAENWIDLKGTRADEIRDLRRAFASLSHHLDPYGLPLVVQLIHFVPSLTPRVVEYTIALHDVDPESVESVLDRLREHGSLSDWQRIWLLYAFRRLGLLEGDDDRIAWTRLVVAEARTALIRAEGTLALAAVGEVDFDVLDQAIRTEPEVLAPWYVLAVRALAESSATVDEKAITALAKSSPINRCLLA